jgi:SAM-dependent methyltransferase
MARNKDAKESSNNITSSKAESVLPRHNCEYNSLDYWEDRFSKETQYEWLLSYRQLASKLSNYLTFSSQILIVGCGNAPFSIDLYDAGYHNIINIDYSARVIASMREQHSESRPDMQWIINDMTNLTFADSSFDVIIDKAAFDAMLADEGDVWNPNQPSIDAAHQACRSISRVLRNDGVFLQISLVQPHFRRKYLLGWHKNKNSETHDEKYSDEFGWSLELQNAADDSESSFGHFLYIMTKQNKANSK